MGVSYYRPNDCMFKGPPRPTTRKLSSSGLLSPWVRNHRQLVVFKYRGPAMRKVCSCHNVTIIHSYDGRRSISVRTFFHEICTLCVILWLKITIWECPLKRFLPDWLAHWGRLVHICICRLTTNGLSPFWWCVNFVAKPLSKPMLEYC